MTTLRRNDRITKNTVVSSTSVLGMPESVDLEKRTMTVTLTTCSRDRQGDVVESGGLDFSAFLRNPVVLWAHDLERPPVGKVISVTPGPDTVTAEICFADTPFAREVFELYAGGFLHAWSIGFIPRRWERLPRAGNEPGGFHVLEAEIVEVSAVPVPANAEALTHALKTVRHADLRNALERPPARLDQDDLASTGSVASRSTDADLPPTAPLFAKRADGGLRERCVMPAADDLSSKALTPEQLATLATRLVDTLVPDAVQKAIASARGGLRAT